MEEDIVYLGSSIISSCTIDTMHHKHNGRSKLTVVTFKEHRNEAFLFHGDLTKLFNMKQKVNITYANNAIIGNSNHERMINHRWITEIKLTYPQIQPNIHRKRINWTIW